MTGKPDSGAEHRDSPELPSNRDEPIRMTGRDGLYSFAATKGFTPPPAASVIYVRVKHDAEERIELADPGRALIISAQRSALRSRR
jgi:hypothetical protein